jgi:hypothetical protein
MRFERVFLALFLVLFAGIASPQPFVSAPLAPPHPPNGPPCWPPTPNGLATWWTFDEPAGTTSSDFGGAVNNIGTDHGTVTRVTGQAGRALSFDGTAKWIEVADHPEVNFTGDCATAGEAGTINFWVRTTRNVGVATILDKRDTSGGNFIRGYSVYLWNGHLGFQIATGPGNLLCNSSGSACTNSIATPLPSVADGQWHFVAISLARCTTGLGLFYVDGQTMPFPLRVGDMTSTSSLVIGRLSPSLGTQFFAGEVDELDFFKTALTALDLDQLSGPKTAGMCPYIY